MGASNSKVEKERSLELCLERKKLVKKALDRMSLLADAHVNYIQSLKDTGRALQEFFEPDVPIEYDLHDSTDANKEPPVPNEKHSNGGSPRKIEEKVASPGTNRVTVPNVSHDGTSDPNELKEPVSCLSPLLVETSPWDYFDLSLTVDDQESARKINGYKGLDPGAETKITPNAEEEKNANEPTSNIFESEDKEEINFVFEQNDFNESTKDCGKPLSKNIRLASDIMDSVTSPSIASESTEISEIFHMGRGRSPDLSPLREIASSVSTPVTLTKLTDIQETDIQENIVEHKANPIALYSSMKDIVQLFIEASDSGQEVLRMLEANKLHFHRQLPKHKGESKKPWFLIACFSHQEEPYLVSDESCLVSKRYLTSRRNMSARSFSSTASQNPREGLANSSNDIHCMISGSHISTLDRLYAWENKLYNEVKACHVVRRRYDLKCKLLRQQEYKAKSAKKVDKTRAVIKDLHSSIRVSINRMEIISRKIICIRDSELQPQFEELIKGLGNMWQKMHEFHERQFDIISAALSIPTEIDINLEKRQPRRYHLEQQLNLTSSNYIRAVIAYEYYIKEIEGWISKCVFLPEKSSKRSRKHQPIPINKDSPPIFVTCCIWLEGLEKLAETSRLSPNQDKHPSVDESVNFCTSLVQFISQLKTFSESSANVYKELDKSIQTITGNHRSS